MVRRSVSNLRAVLIPSKPQERLVTNISQYPGRVALRPPGEGVGCLMDTAVAMEGYADPSYGFMQHRHTLAVLRLGNSGKRRRN